MCVQTKFQRGRARSIPTATPSTLNRLPSKTHKTNGIQQRVLWSKMCFPTAYYRDWDRGKWWFTAFVFEQKQAVERWSGCGGRSTGQRPLLKTMCSSQRNTLRFDFSIQMLRSDQNQEMFCSLFHWPNAGLRPQPQLHHYSNWTLARGSQSNTFHDGYQWWPNES